jgi:hypothetical protein
LDTEGDVVFSTPVGDDRSDGASTRGGRRVQGLVWPAVLLVVVVLAYARTMNYGFHFDDYVLATHWSRADIVESFHSQFDPSKFNDAYFRPLVSVSFALDWAVWGTNAFGYHLTNLVLHAAVVLSIYGLARFTSLPGWAAAIGAGYFALVPSNAATVVYVAERSDSLSVLFVLWGLLCVAGFHRSRRVRYLVGMVACFVMALLAKEIGIALLMVAPIWWLYFGMVELDPSIDSAASRAPSRSLASHWRDEWRLATSSLVTRSRRRDWFRLMVPLVTTTIVYLVYRQSVLPSGSLGARFSETQSPVRALVGGVRSTFAGVPWEVSGKIIYALAGGLAFAVVIRPTSHHWRVGLVGVLTTVALVAPLAFSGGVEPRLLYGAQVGVAILVAAAASAVAEAVAARSGANVRLPVIGAAGVVAVAVLWTATTALVESQDLYRPGSTFKLEFDLRLWNRPDQLRAMPPEYVAEIGERLFEAGLIADPTPP